MEWLEPPGRFLLPWREPNSYLPTIEPPSPTFKAAGSRPTTLRGGYAIKVNEVGCVLVVVVGYFPPPLASPHFTQFV